MKQTRLLSILSVAFLIGLTSAQSQDSRSTGDLSLEERKASVANLELHIQQRESRMAELAEDILSLDKRVEKQISELIDSLNSRKDSEASKTQVSRTKEEAILGLRRTIEFYHQKRAEIREQLRTGKTGVPLDTLSSDVEKFDQRIEKRIEQIIDLTKSFTGHEDFPKYVVTETSSWGWDNWTWENEEINEAWRQNRRDVRHTEGQRREITEALQKNIDDLNQRQAYLKEKLKEGTLSDTEAQLYRSDLSRLDGIVGARTQQLEKLSSESEPPKTKETGRHEAYDLDQMLEDARKDLRTDFLGIFTKYDELNRQRAQIANLRENLEARKKWLKENGGGE